MKKFGNQEVYVRRFMSHSERPPQNSIKRDGLIRRPPPGSGPRYRPEQRMQEARQRWRFARCCHVASSTRPRGAHRPPAGLSISSNRSVFIQPSDRTGFSSGGCVWKIDGTERNDPSEMQKAGAAFATPAFWSSWALLTSCGRRGRDPCAPDGSRRQKCGPVPSASAAAGSGSRPCCWQSSSSAPRQPC